MRCKACGGELISTSVVPDETIAVRGVERHTFICSACHVMERRFVYIKDGREPDRPQQHRSFGPDELSVLTTAFDAVLLELGLGRNDPAALMVARRMMALAQEGERDPIRLREGGIKWHLRSVAQRSAPARLY